MEESVQNYSTGESSIEEEEGSLAFVMKNIIKNKKSVNSREGSELIREIDDTILDYLN